MQWQQREEENPKIGRILHAKFNSGWKNLQSLFKVKVQREEENPKIGRILHAKFNSGWNNLQSLFKVKVFII